MGVGKDEDKQDFLDVGAQTLITDYCSKELLQFAAPGPCCSNHMGWDVAWAKARSSKSCETLRIQSPIRGEASFYRAYIWWCSYLYYTDLGGLRIHFTSTAIDTISLWQNPPLEVYPVWWIYGSINITPCHLTSAAFAKRPLFTDLSIPVRGPCAFDLQGVGFLIFGYSL